MKQKMDDGIIALLGGKIPTLASYINDFVHFQSRDFPVELYCNPSLVLLLGSLLHF